MSKKVVFIIAQNRFRDEELLDSKAVLDSRGVQTKVASKTRKKAMGKLGTEIEPDLAVAEIKPADFDAIILIGGSGATEYFGDETVLKLIMGFKAAGKILAAICIAPSILANAGALISKTATAFPTEENNLRSKGANYTGMPLETDGNIITARGPEVAKEFGEQIAFLLAV